MHEDADARKKKLHDFMSAERYCVVATNSPNGAPEASLVGFAVTPALEVIFETTDATRKCSNLRRDPRISLVIAKDQFTLQYEGTVDEPDGSELEELKATFFSAWPQLRSHEEWPGLTYFRIKPRWVRFSSYYRPRSVEEMSFELEDGTPRKPDGPHFRLQDLIGNMRSYWNAKKS